MKPLSTHLYYLLATTLLTAIAAPSIHAATAFSWDGGFVGGANNSGNWTDTTNWNPDGTPSLSNADTVTLGNVTSGSRTISINNGETATAKSLTFTQTTTGATNILSIASGGTLNLGGGQTWAAATAGTSQVDLGGIVDFTGFSSGNVNINNTLNFTADGATLKSSNTNAPSSSGTGFGFNGTVTVDVGSTHTATIAYTQTRNMYVAFGTTSTLSITTGTLEFSSALYNSSPGVSVTVNGATTIAAGAGLKLTSDSGNNAGGGSSGVLFTNSSTGTLSQAGTITTNGRGSGGANTLTNSGTWKVNGTGAIIEKLRSTSASPTFVNSSGAIFTGATAADKIDFNHTTAGTDIAFTNSGIIAAGNGSNGSGLTSVGTLTLVDFAVTNSVTTSSLVFDLGGTTAGQFDVLALQSGSMNLTNATLAINLVNGFTPSTSSSWNILTSDVPASVTGSFVGLTINGSPDANYSFAYNSSTGIGTLSYTAASIPEPSAATALLGLSGLAWTLVRRRRLADRA